MQTPGGVLRVIEHWLRASLPAGAWQAVTTTRNGGVSKGAYAGLNLAAHVGDATEAVARNRQLLGEALRGRWDVPRIQWLNQVHGTRCMRADRGTTAAVPEADAAWTDHKGIALAVLTADCLPVVVVHREGAAVAVAHAGWRGLVRGVLNAVLQALPGGPADYRAWIGPGIGVDAYQVGEEVADAVRGMSGVGLLNGAYLRPSPGPKPGPIPGEGDKFQLDLAGLASAQLNLLGVERIACERVCSFTDQRFYSYRRDGVTGRMATLVWLDPTG